MPHTLLPPSEVRKLELPVGGLLWRITELASKSWTTQASVTMTEQQADKIISQNKEMIELLESIDNKLEDINDPYRENSKRLLVRIAGRLDKVRDKLYGMERGSKKKNKK